MNKDFMNGVKAVLWDTTIESENRINQLKREMDTDSKDDPIRKEELLEEIREFEQGIDDLKRISTELETALNSQILKIDNYKKSSLVDSNINSLDKSNEQELVDDEELDNAEIELEEENTDEKDLVDDQEEMVEEEPVEAVELSSPEEQPVAEVEVPKVEEAVAEQPVAEVEVPKVEEAVAEQPVAEVEVPKEEVVAEQPVAEVEVPKEEVVAEQPVAEVEVPKEEVVAEQPVAEVEVPKVEDAVAEQPVAEVEVPKVEEAVAEQPVAEVEVPKVEEAVAEQPVAEVEVPKVEEAVAEQPVAAVEVPKVEDAEKAYQKTSITEDRGVLVSTAQATKARESFDNQNVLQTEISRKGDEIAPAVEQGATPTDTPVVEENAPAALSSEEELERMTQEYTEALTSGDEQKANELSNAISEKSKTLQKNN